MNAPLRGRIGRWQFLALGFGTVVGSAWVAILGDWLTAAGPGGAIVGLMAGGVCMALIGLCYAELTTRVPEAGGEFVYALRIFGPRIAFAVAWLTLLMLVAIMIFEGLALAWFIGRLLPSWSQTPVYTLFGETITWEALGIGTLGALGAAFLNWRGGTFSARAHAGMTLILVVGAGVLVVAYFSYGSTAHLAPFWGRPDGEAWWRGALWIFALSAVLLNGFQTIPHAVEERSAEVSLRTVAGTIAMSILAAALFYVIIVLGAASVMPWRELAQSDLAVIAAAAQLPRGALWQDAVLLIAIVSLFKTWNGVAFMAARLALAAARAGLLPGALARVHPRHGSPMVAVAVLAVINILGLVLGRGAIVPLLNAAAMGMTVILAMTVLGLWVLKRRGGGAPYQVPGGRALVGAAMLLAWTMAAVAFIDPWLVVGGGVPLEWKLLWGWVALGLVVWPMAAAAAAAAREPGQQRGSAE